MVWTSPYAPVEAGGTLLDLVASTAAARGDEPALVDGPSGATVTYAALADRIERAAAGIAACGVAPGDVVALQAPNSPQWVAVALGAMAAGATVSGVSPLAVEREVRAQVDDCGARLLVGAADFDALVATGTSPPRIA